MSASCLYTILLFDSGSVVCFIRQVSYARPSNENIKGANLYISGLPKTMGLQEMERTFSACGKIISARIICDSYTGQYI